MNTRGRAFDLKIKGVGFFLLQPGAGALEPGSTLYTRLGNFQKNNQGRLQTECGCLLDCNVMIPVQAHQVRVSSNGFVESVGPDENKPFVVGRIELASFVNPAGLDEIKPGFFKETTDSGQAVRGLPGQAGFGFLVQGQLEPDASEVIDALMNECCQALDL